MTATRKSLTCKVSDSNVSLELAKGEKCKSHKPSKLGYLEKHNEAERRMKKGMKQKQCPTCKYWFWKDEM